MTLRRQTWTMTLRRQTWTMTLRRRLWSLLVIVIVLGVMHVLVAVMRNSASGLARSAADHPTTTATSRRDPFVIDHDVDFASCFAHCTLRNRAKLPHDDNCTSTLHHWCHTAYTPAIVTEFCTLLCRNQFPAHCSNAKFLVALNEYHTGIGSNMHVLMMLMTMALDHGRVLVFSPFIKSHWTHAKDPHPPCARGEMACYYAPIAHCALPVEWQRSAVPLILSTAASSPRTDAMTATAHVATVNLTWYVYGNYSLASRPRAMAATKNLPVSWFNAQFASFMFRPSAHAMREVIAPLVRATFANVSTVLPERFAAVFMRRGDKWKEAPLRAPAEYWSAIQRVCTARGIEHVYVNSDSFVAIDELRALARNSSLVLHSISFRHARIWKGMGKNTMREQFWSQPRVRLLMNLALTDFFISKEATAWIGTLSSNTCRMHDELRCGNGRFGHAYESLDGPWCAAGNKAMCILA